MTIQLGQIAPDFEQDTTQGRIRFHEWLGGSWAVLFSHPRDFTPVCTTELGVVARLGPEWRRRGVKVIGLSVDPSERHAAWESDVAETQGCAVDFPMIADQDRSVATLYGMVHPDADPMVTVRTVFVIDPDRRVRLTLELARELAQMPDILLRLLTLYPPEVVAARVRTQGYPAAESLAVPLSRKGQYLLWHLAGWSGSLARASAPAC